MNNEMLKELKIKFQTLSMYFNTLKEMFYKDTSEEAIKSVNNEISSVMCDIQNIFDGKYELPKIDEAFVSSFKLDTLDNKHKNDVESLFDMIKKSKDVDYKSIIPVKHRGHKNENITEKNEDDVSVDDFESVKDNLDRVLQNRDNILSTEWIKNNNFIVSIDRLKIPKINISSIDADKDGMITMIVNDFVGKDGPLESILLGELQNPKECKITITVLENNGTEFYRKVYDGCILTGYESTKFDYSNSDLRKFKLTFSSKKYYIE